MKIVFFKYGICFLNDHDGIAYRGVYEIQFHPLPWIIFDGANDKQLAFGWRKNSILPEIYRH